MNFPEFSSLIAFTAASLVVLLIPGPGVAYVVTRSATQGTRAGFASVLGLSTGALVHVAAVTLGLSAVLVTSAIAFNIIKYLGAAYLIYMGMRILLSRNQLLKTAGLNTASSGRLVIDGVLISVFNPKIAVFFMAYLPQFVDPALGSVTGQLLFLGILYVGLSVITDGGYALAAGKTGEWLKGRLMQGPVPRYISGTIFIGLGIQTALTGRSKLGSEW